MVATSLALGALSMTLQAGRTGVGMRVDYTGKAVRRLHRTMADWSHRPRGDAAQRGVGVVATDAPDVAALRARVAAYDWYHTFDLGHGIITPGVFDHRASVQHYHLPERLDGQRVLDAGTSDGFWAFEFERRGAAEVVALDVERWADLDLPPPVRSAMSQAELEFRSGTGFGIVRDALRWKTQQTIGSVYTMSPDTIGRFDLSQISNVLVHLRDPALALQNLCRVTSGQAIIAEIVDSELEGDSRGPLMAYCGGLTMCNWWRFNTAALVRMALDAGFRSAEVIARFKPPYYGGPKESLGGGRPRNLHQIVIVARND